MTDDKANHTVGLLRRMASGDDLAANELLSTVYDEMHRIADRLMRRERVNHTLQPTALIHEAFVRLVGSERGAEWEGRAHFLRVAATAMRSVLVDHARAQATLKRSGERPSMTLNDDCVADGGQFEQVLAVHECIEALSKSHEQEAKIVELRFFGGFTHQEISEMIGTSLRSVERGWQFARAWLRYQFDESDPQR